MKFERPSVLALVALLAGLACPAVRAAGDGLVPYLSGGVGDEDRARMEQAAAGHSLGLLFATPQGEYLANVEVLIRDARGGAVLDATSTGPMMLVDLPAGRYEVEASYRGQPQQRRVQIPAHGHRQVVMRWASSD